MGEENHENTGDKRKWRKKKKNFLSNAKKYAKKGQMGRGTKIPDELYQYFVGILDALKKGIDDNDERDALVNNVLERTKGEELNIVSNQLGSRVVEILLPYSSPEDLERFIDILSPDIRKLCSDNFTSHIIEALLKTSCRRATEHLQDGEEGEEVPKKKKKSNKTFSEEHLQKCHEFTLKISKYVLNNLEDFVWDSYANHILRSALKCLSGITLLPGEKVNKMFKTDDKDSKGIPPHLTKLTYRVVPDEYKDLVKEFAHRLSSWPQFKDMPFQNLTSALLQVLLYAVKNVDKHITRDLVKKLLDESFAPEDWIGDGNDDKKGDDDKKIDGDGQKIDGDEKIGDDDQKMDGEDKNASDVKTANLPPVFKSQPAVRLLEAALFVAKKKTYTQIYARCFINRLAQLATMPMLNFTVQRLIDNCDVKEEFEPMFDELSGHLGAVLATGNTGVLVALAKACLRLNAKQTHFVNSLQSALGCEADSNARYFPVCCLRLLPLHRVDTAALHSEYFIHVHGSVILQTILDYQRPGKAIQGLLEMSPEELLVVLCDAKGCHVADLVCAGRCVGVKQRDKLIWKLKGYYQKLALSQYGSRAFEQVFNAASLEQKVKIMTELSDKSSLLNSTQYGRVVASNLDVAGFKQSQHNWMQKWNKDKKDKGDGKDKKDKGDKKDGKDKEDS